MRLELTTSSLARRHSTTELLLHGALPQTRTETSDEFKSSPSANWGRRAYWGEVGGSNSYSVGHNHMSFH